jgi:hypothetical protein
VRISSSLTPEKEPSLPWAASVFTLSATPTTVGLLNVMPPLPSLVFFFFFFPTLAHR